MIYAKVVTYSSILYDSKSFYGWALITDIRHAQTDFRLLALLIGNQTSNQLFLHSYCCGANLQNSPQAVRLFGYLPLQFL